jgi:hypothetical protein
LVGRMSKDVRNRMARKKRPLLVRTVGVNLAPEVTFESGAIRHPAAITHSLVLEDWFTRRYVIHPVCRASGIQPPEELIGVPFTNPLLHEPSENHEIGCVAGGIRFLRIDVDEPIARAFVVIA